jgi:hypothetical protein
MKQALVSVTHCYKMLSVIPYTNPNDPEEPCRAQHLKPLNKQSAHPETAILSITNMILS